MWYILHDDMTGHRGRTYRVVPPGRVVMHISGVGWVGSNFPTLQALKRYAATNGFVLHVKEPRNG